MIPAATWFSACCACPEPYTQPVEIQGPVIEGRALLSIDGEPEDCWMGEADGQPVVICKEADLVEDDYVGGD